ncbi:MAG TPA: hypothetical protein VNV41_16470 [Candidatus Acidoferrales bacterium]|jgi:hypothetical protein|nr:hypothetical protein [Candidatus Acidoferrales bacterium]
MTELRPKRLCAPADPNETAVTPTPDIIEVPVGYCQCRCGQRTEISQHTNRRLGFVKGEPRKYCSGHYVRKKGKHPAKPPEPRAPWAYENPQGEAELISLSEKQ